MPYLPEGFHPEPPRSIAIALESKPRARRATFTDAEVRSIRAMRAEGKKLVYIAAIHGSTAAAICNICLGKRHANIVQEPK